MQAKSETSSGAAHTPKTCPAELAYRSMVDIGPARICNSPAKTEAGFCLRHDPATKPQRDNRGRIIARAKGTA